MEQNRSSNDTKLPNNQRSQCVNIFATTYQLQYSSFYFIVTSKTKAFCTRISTTVELKIPRPGSLTEYKPLKCLLLAIICVKKIKILIIQKTNVFSNVSLQRIFNYYMYACYHIQVETNDDLSLDFILYVFPVPWTNTTGKNVYGFATFNS